MNGWDASTTCVIFNPHAASGSVGREWAERERTLREILGPVTFRASRSSGDGAEQAREAIAAGARTLLSLGGDGTHNEVVHGILTSGAPQGSIRLGILPSGTGGDFRRLLLNSDDWLSAAKALPTATTTTIDAGLAIFSDGGIEQRRHFLNICSFGVGGLACSIVNSSKKRLGSKATFFLGTLEAIFRYTPSTIRLSVDGIEVGTYTVTNIAVANGRFFGAGMMVAPNASLTDGLLDVTVVEAGGPLTVLRLIATIYRGKHTELDCVKTFRGAAITAELVGSNPAYIDLDGEAPGRIPIRIEVVPGALQLLLLRPQGEPA
ncbi:MAG: diacylglycerol kinase family lipid kinase [Deltaproteobacteria bacterium]|nr:diacylglycerol kinase family lipid kinase [Deltaproteobacteria bacterium]